MIGDLEDPGGKERLLATNWEQLGLFPAPCTPSHIILKRTNGQKQGHWIFGLFFFFTCFFVALISFLVGDSFCPLPLRQRSERTFCGQRAHSMAEGSLQKNTYIPHICHFLHNRNMRPRNFALESV